MENKKNYILIGVLIVVIVGALLVKYFSGKTHENLLNGDTVIGQSLSSKEQAEVDNYLKDELVKNKYTLDRAKVYVNPYNANPLSAMIIFYTDKSLEGSLPRCAESTRPQLRYRGLPTCIRHCFWSSCSVL